MMWVRWLWAATVLLKESAYLVCSVPAANIQCVCKINEYLNHSGYYTNYLSLHKNFYVLPTHCIYVFCVDLRTNSD